MSSKCKCNWRCQHLHSSTTEDLKTLKGFRAQSQCLLIKKIFQAYLMWFSSPTQYGCIDGL